MTLAPVDGVRVRLDPRMRGVLAAGTSVTGLSHYMDMRATKLSESKLIVSGSKSGISIMRRRSKGWEWKGSWYL